MKYAEFRQRRASQSRKRHPRDFCHGLLRRHAKAWALADVSADSDVLLRRAFEMFEILLQRRVVKLGEKARFGSGVELADILDELTFGHKVFTFGLGGYRSQSHKPALRPAL